MFTFYLARQSSFLNLLATCSPPKLRYPRREHFLFVYSISTCFISATVVNCGLVLSEFSIVLNIDLRFLNETMKTVS